MNCIDCKSPNPDENLFCGKCGSEMGRTLDETVRKKGFRDRQATEMEIMDSVVGRLMKWATWLGSVATLIVILFGVLVSKGCYDVQTAVESGKTSITNAVDKSQKDIDATRQATATLNTKVQQLRSDTDKYKKVNDDIGKLQKDLLKVKGQVIDLSKADLTVNTLKTSGLGGESSSFSFGNLGCSQNALNGGYKVGYCAQGSPPTLYQNLPERRSATGFQFISGRLSGFFRGREV